MVRVRRHNNSGMGVLLLASTIMNIGVEHIPPVTLALVAGQTAIFLGFLPKLFPSTLGVCMSSYLVIQHRDYRRLILGSLAHADDMHLYFNMLSLIYKGIKLERAFGSPYFAYLVAVFTGLTSVTYVAIGEGLANVLDDQRYITTCAVGFSGVLFALKVLATEYSRPGTQYAFGVIPVPSKYFFWVELIAIQLVSPNASFVGHLAGILVGLAYTRGPLKMLMNAFFTPGNYTPGSTPHSSRASSRGSRTSSAYSSFAGLFSRGDNEHPRPASPPHTSRFERNHRPSERTARPGNRPMPHVLDESDIESEHRHFGPSYASYTAEGGMSEQEQMRRAMQESRDLQAHNYQMQYQYPYSPPSSSSSDGSGDSPPVYPDLSELRDRRSQFYQERN